jgi:hypothetical protein
MLFRKLEQLHEEEKFWRAMDGLNVMCARTKAWETTINLSFEASHGWSQCDVC